MITSDTITIGHDKNYLSYDDVKRIAHFAVNCSQARTVIIDLSRTDETCTAALARLVLLRGRLIRLRRDLRLVGLTGKAESLYQICQMKSLLPRSHYRQALMTVA